MHEAQLSLRRGAAVGPAQMGEPKTASREELESARAQLAAVVERTRQQHADMRAMLQQQGSALGPATAHTVGPLASQPGVPASHNVGMAAAQTAWGDPNARLDVMLNEGRQQLGVGRCMLSASLEGTARCTVPT